MKTIFIKILLPLSFLLPGSLILFSCSDNDPKINPTAGLMKVSEGFAGGAGTKVEVWAKEELFAGYNELYFILLDSVNGNVIVDSEIHLTPVMNMHTMSHSCPVEQPEARAVKGLFPAAIMFTMPSGDMGSWTLEVTVQNNVIASFGKVTLNIDVKGTSPSRVISFQSTSGIKYYLSYQFPEKTKIGINDFDVIVFTTHEGSFVPVENLTIQLTPEMPSMDHGSPNNENPTHIGDGHYKGKANFTMTGDWRLHLELADEYHGLIATKYFDILVQ